MKRVACGLLVVAAGCGNVSGVLDRLGLRPSTMTLRLVNETPFVVKPSVFVGGGVGDLLLDSLTEQVLTLDANRQNFSNLEPDQQVARSYSCGDFKAVMAKNAELMTGVGLSPDADSAVFVVDRDFRCGDTVTIRYTGTLGNFDARISASAFDPLELIGVLTGQP